MGLPIDEKDHELFRVSTKITLGSGDKTKFWKDVWMGSTPLKVVAPNLYRIVTRKNRTVREALEGNNWIADIRRKIAEHHILHKWHSHRKYQMTSVGNGLSQGYIPPGRHTRHSSWVL